MVDLLPCPFCGGTELSHGYSWPPEIGVVQCHSCDALVTADSEDEAITKWNRRAAPSAGLREALEKAAKQFEFYAREHRDKARASRFNGIEVIAKNSDDKAETNERFASMCRAALTLSKEGGSALTPHQTNARDE